MSDFGIIGMAAMGLNLALNGASKGFKVSIFNRSLERMQDALNSAAKENLSLCGFRVLEDFVKSIQKPRKIIMMVQAGQAVDATIDDLLPFMQADDILIDGGNEFYANTETRIKKVSESDIRYIGMGVSGGEAGARNGPSFMPGGTRSTYLVVEPLLQALAATVDGTPCVAYMGKRSAGNYVKMVHNGIEYGDMQLIAECYDMLKRFTKLNNDQIADVFSKWNSGPLASYLMEITSTILRTKNPDSDDKEYPYLLDSVLDIAEAKGTCKWTVREAAELGVPCPTIQAGLDSRYLSTLVEIRLKARLALWNDKTDHVKCFLVMNETQMEGLLSDIENALYCSRICTYAQGLMLLQKASETYSYDMDLEAVIRVWTGGCIIRADFLKDLSTVFQQNPNLKSILVSEHFAEKIKERTPGWRRAISLAMRNSIPVPALAASLTYFDSLRSNHLPMNLIQALRDHFGAHTFKQIGKAGSVHANWVAGTYK